MCNHTVPIAVKIIKVTIKGVETKSITLKNTDRIIVINEATTKDFAILLSPKNVFITIMKKNDNNNPGMNQLFTVELIQLKKSTPDVMFPEVGGVNGIYNLPPLNAADINTKITNA